MTLFDNNDNDSLLMIHYYCYCHYCHHHCHWLPTSVSREIFSLITSIIIIIIIIVILIILIITTNKNNNNNNNINDTLSGVTALSPALASASALVVTTNMDNLLTFATPNNVHHKGLEEH